MVEEKTYLFGPVPSRRLGLSLGVDIVPFKVCTLDCLYCQLGPTTEKTLERADYVPIEPVLAQLRERVAAGLQADYITISGSGEPTLNSRLGEFIDKIKTITDIPVAVLTNGTLLHRADVRSDCAKADLLVPSLDAADEQTFQKINRPHDDIKISSMIEGLAKFRREFTGQIWLEVFVIAGCNTEIEQIEKIKTAIKQIQPDKIQLNTAVRPTAEPGIGKIEFDQLRKIAEQLGPNCEIIADFSAKHRCLNIESKVDDVLSVLKRRPCSLNDICSGLGIHRNEALKYITYLQQKGLIETEEKGAIAFFKAI